VERDQDEHDVERGMKNRVIGSSGDRVIGKAGVIAKIARIAKIAGSERQ